MNVSEGQKRYNIFIEEYKRAYPSLPKEKQYKNGQELWNKIKKDQERYDKTIIELREKAAKATTSTFSFWSKAVSPSVKKKKVLNIDDKEQTDTPTKSNDDVEKTGNPTTSNEGTKELCNKYYISI